MVVWWIALMLLFIIAEAATVQVITVWFALGSLAGLITELAGGEKWLQFLVFIVVSLVSLVATKPLVKKFMGGKAQALNADRCIGETAVVISDIDNVLGQGQVNVKGAVWTARSANGEKISEGSRVKILAIEGVKLSVELLAEESKKSHAQTP